jgi:hypothetical protein
MKEALKKTAITKDVSLHSLRHAYDTHLLEEGVNIVTIKASGFFSKCIPKLPKDPQSPYGLSYTFPFKSILAFNFAKWFPGLKSTDSPLSSPS